MSLFIAVVGVARGIAASTALVAGSDSTGGTKPSAMKMKEAHDAKYP
jgi:hypothetical protein